jgi:predicted enzyme related to lactoylglutathione lyase
MNRPVHFEILGDDPAALAEFYRGIFGWEIATMEGQGYWMATTGAAGTPGIDGGFMHRHFPQAVINTLEVPSWEDAVRRIESAGGKRLNDPHEIPRVGTHLYCADPEGNLFGILQPAAGEAS